jgi:hypothetical protein
MERSNNPFEKDDILDAFKQQMNTALSGFLDKTQKLR